MFKGLKQLGSILLLCTLLLSINSYVFAQSEELNKCLNEKLTSSEYGTTLKQISDQTIKCKKIAVTEQEAYYKLCDTTMLKTAETECEKDENSNECKLANIAYNECRGKADQEREIKDAKCDEPYTKKYDEIVKIITPICEEEIKTAQAMKAQEDANKKCGNGTKEDKEECDDGNTQSGDGCSDLCKVESVIPPGLPNISTLVKPEVENVSQVSPYLSNTFLPRVAKTIVSFGIGAAVLGLILGSIGLLTAYGNDEKYGNAKKGIYFSLIGLIICLLAFAIVQLIFYTGFQAGQIR